MVHGKSFPSRVIGCRLFRPTELTILLTHNPKSMGPTYINIVLMVFTSVHSVNKTKFFEAWVNEFKNNLRLFSSDELCIVNSMAIGIILEHNWVPQQCVVTSLETQWSRAPVPPISTFSPRYTHRSVHRFLFPVRSKFSPSIYWVLFWHFLFFPCSSIFCVVFTEILAHLAVNFCLFMPLFLLSTQV